VQGGKKQVAFSDAALEAALARHASALFGRETSLLEAPKRPLHGPVSWVRITTGADWGRAAGNSAQQREEFPCTLEVFWALSAERTHIAREAIDRFVALLDRAARVRVGAAGLTYAILERPMMKDAAAVNAAFGEALLARPHAHANHFAVLDTRTQCVEPAWWVYLGRRHLERLGAGATLADFAPHGFASGGVSISTADTSPIAAEEQAVRAQVALANALGPLYPPRVVADATHSPHTVLADGSELTIRHWMERYANPCFVAHLGFRTAGTA
jgi:hypothetical protein